MSKTGAHGNSFQWTDEEWAILEPLTPWQRMHLGMSVIFAGGGLVAYVKKHGVPTEAEANKAASMFNK